MKAAESKSAATSAKKSSHFFSKDSEHHFFGSAGKETSFFSNTNSFFSIQPKLTIGQPNDKYEQEADSMADKVVHRLSENKTDVTNKNGNAIQTKPIAPLTTITPFVQTKCATCEQEEKLQKKEQDDETELLKGKLQKKPIFESNAEPPDDEKNIQRKCAECEKEDEKKLQTKSGNNSIPTAAPSIEKNLNSSKGSGNPLPAATREQMESSFGADFSNVRIHNDSSAMQMNKDLHAQAFTHGNDIYFNSGKYDSNSNTGKSLLAHELTHVVQQTNFLQRQKIPATDVKPKPPKINYKTAQAQNKFFSNPDSLGWESKLESVAGGLYKGWFDLWKAGKYDEFADAIAQYQVDKGFKKFDIDGILGLGTWAKLAGYGEAIAGIQSVQWERSKDTCTIASEERIKRGHKLATGNKFELAKDKSEKTFNAILQSIEGRMGDIDEMYRGTGAAGAMVYAGFATYVPEADIWTGGLRPGAPMQVWGNRDAYNLLRKGVIEYKVKGVTKTRPLIPEDANFYGTSFVFVRYDDPKKPTKMLVRHFDSPEWKSKTDYAVWVAANLN